MWRSHIILHDDDSSKSNYCTRKYQRSKTRRNDWQYSSRFPLSHDTKINIKSSSIHPIRTLYIFKLPSRTGAPSTCQRQSQIPRAQQAFRFNRIAIVPRIRSLCLQSTQHKRPSLISLLCLSFIQCHSIKEMTSQSSHISACFELNARAPRTSPNCPIHCAEASVGPKKQLAVTIGTVFHYGGNRFTDTGHIRSTFTNMKYLPTVRNLDNANRSIEQQQQYDGKWGPNRFELMRRCNR